MLKIAIPSYKRSTVIGKKTLKSLREEGFIASDINIFVANEQEAEDYKRDVDAILYNDIIIGVPTLVAQRKFINNYYPQDTYLVCMDDDIRGFKKLRECHLPTLFLKAFFYCQENAIPMWGIYPTDNDRFMKDCWSEGLFNICGICYGSIARDIQSDIEFKDDWYRSLAGFKEYGKLLRIDFLAPKTTYWAGKGGYNVYRTFDNQKEVAEKLLDMFPEYVDRVYTKPNGHPDIKLKKMPRVSYLELSS
jgi:hypothetical protein